MKVHLSRKLQKINANDRIRKYLEMQEILEMINKRHNIKDQLLLERLKLLKTIFTKIRRLIRRIDDFEKKFLLLISGSGVLKEEIPWRGSNLEIENLRRLTLTSQIFLQLKQRREEWLSLHRNLGWIKHNSHLLPLFKEPSYICLEVTKRQIKMKT